jgi:hypothetical protein
MYAAVPRIILCIVIAGEVMVAELAGLKPGPTPGEWAPASAGAIAAGDSSRPDAKLFA